MADSRGHSSRTGGGTDSPGAPGAAAPPTMAGLRERKKQRTRRAIFEAAFRLFADRGYDGVTMAEIAHAADVAPATVFTHYASKEDLFYGLRAEMNGALAAALRDHPEVDALTAVRDWQLATFDDLLAPEAVDRTRTFARIVMDTPALSSRSSGFAQERQTLLADLLSARMPESDDFEVELAAAHVMAVIQTLLRFFQVDLNDGRSAEAVRSRSRERTVAAFEQLRSAFAAVR